LALVKYTNEHNIPIEIIRAVENDGYTKGEAAISVTGLLQPPQISILTEKHSDALTADISERIWILLGQSIHTILERANEGREGVISELRMYAKVLGWTFSGQADSIFNKKCTDYKITSAYTVKNALKDEKPEWIQQLNCYGWLANSYEKPELEVDQLEIVAISRDWSKFQYQRSGGDYPPAPVTTIKIPWWGAEKQQAFIEERIAIHQEAEAQFVIDGTLPPCTDEERWKKEDTFRVIKEGRKSALRVLPTQEEADQFMDGHKDEKHLSVELAVGKPVRCESYCSVADFCKQFIEEKQ